MSHGPTGAPADDPGEVTVDLHGFTHGGEGVGRLPEGKVVFVPRAIPGERVRIRVVDERRSWARGELREVVEASPDRLAPPCPYVPECGGCDLQHITPDRQRRLKERVVRDQLERIGHLTDPPVAPTRRVGPDTRYRSHARFHAVGQTGGGFDPRLGFHRAGSHQVVPVEDCLVLNEQAQAVREAVGDASGAAEVTVRAHPETGTAAAVLRPGPGVLDSPAGDFDLALEQPDGSLAPLRGEAVLAARVAGFTYRFDASCFFQVSAGGAEAVVGEVLEAAGDVFGLPAWDLYAGVGLVSLPLARAGAAVTAVEGHPASATWARRNAEDAGVEVTVVREDVAGFVAESAGPVGGPELVVLDPPRSGAGLEVVRDLARAAPRQVVYVSCDPAALARDVRALVEEGYTLERAVPLDLFPHTHHVEVVAALTRR